jgi:dienelactone hydrolase
MRRTRSQLFAGFAGGLLAVTLAACGGPGQNRPEPHGGTNFRGAQNVDRGYRGANYTPGSTVNGRWSSPQGDYDIVFSAPLEDGPHPVVLYLPGLGDPAESGMNWRRAWVEAGYAVLGVQPVDIGPTLLTGREARNGDFADIAATHMQLDSTAKLAQAALAELHRRAVAGIEPFRQADTTHWVAAGFGRGAAVTLRLAGATAPGIPTPDAVIALSPSVDATIDGLRQQLSSIRAPVLTVTGRNDHDPFFPSASSSFREEIYRRLPAGDHVLLMLDDGAHTSLAGNGAAAGPDEAAAPRDRQGDDSGNSRGRGRRGGGGGGGPNGGGGQGGGSGGRGGLGDGPGRSAEGMRGNAGQFEAGIITSVSQAFLDANLRRDANARHWLQGNAPDWLDGYGVLRSRRKSVGAVSDGS